MGKVVVSEFVTLDGVMHAPHEWSFPFWNDEIAKFKFDELFASDALLLGRVTYEGFAAAWPSQTDEQGYADRINSLPKYVVSTTLKQAAWKNSRLIKRNIAAEVSRLKEEPGQDILVFGSGTLVVGMLSQGLIDEFALLVYPIVLGKGKRLFQEGSHTSLRLVDTKSFGSSVVLVSYEVAKE